MIIKRSVLIILAVSLLLIVVNNLTAQIVGPDGSFNYSYPIEIPPGINGMQPSLSLNYNSPEYLSQIKAFFFRKLAGAKRLHNRESEEKEGLVM